MITTPLLDDFNRPSEDPLSQGGNWSEIVSWAAGPMRLTNPLVGLPAATSVFVPGASYRTDIALPAGDAECWGQVGRCDASNETIGLLLHVADPDTALDAYYATVGNRIGNNWLIFEINNGTASLIAQGGGDNTPQANNDYLLFRRNGNDLEFWWWQFSLGFALADPAGWTLMLSVTDTTFTGGTIGLDAATGDQEAYWRGFGGGVERQTRLQQIIRYR